MSSSRAAVGNFSMPPKGDDEDGKSKQPPKLSRISGPIDSPRAKKTIGKAEQKRRDEQRARSGRGSIVSAKGDGGGKRVHDMREKVLSAAATNGFIDPSINVMKTGEPKSQDNRAKNSGRRRISTSGARGGRGKRLHTGNNNTRMEPEYTKLIVDHFDGTARGGDIPHCHESKFKKWAQDKRNLLLITLPKEGSISKSKVYGGKERMSDLRMRYNLFSQNPWMQFHLKENEGAAYFPVHFEMFELSPADGRPPLERFNTTELPEKADAIAELLNKQLGITVTLPHAKAILQMTTKTGETKPGGASFFSLALKSKSWLKNASLASIETEYERLAHEISESTRILVARPEWYPSQYLDSHFDNLVKRMTNAEFTSGKSASVWPHFAPHIHPETGFTFKDFVGKNATGNLPHLPWMANPLEPNTYASLPVQTVFSSLRDFEIVNSAAVIYDRDTTKHVLQKVFAVERPHLVNARTGRFPNQWLFHVSVLKKDDEKYIPAVSVGTAVTLKRMFVGADYKVSAAGDKSKTIMDLDFVKPTDIFPDIKGRVIEHQTDCDFVVSCFIENPLESKWVSGNSGHASLVTTMNTIPAERQLEAIAKLSKLDPETNLAKILLAQNSKGLKDGKSLKEEFIDKVEPVVRLALQKYEARSECNPEQEQGVINTLTGKKGFCLIQGPPGTGKSTTIDYIANYAAASGAKVSVTAPANIPTKSLVQDIGLEFFSYMECLQEAREELGIMPVDENEFKIVFVPTRAQAGKDLIDAFNWVTEELGDDTTNFVRQYSLSTHLCDLAIKKAKAGDKDASNWLSLKNKLISKQTVHKTELLAWKKIGLSWAPEVFQDPKVKIVISTCNNHANELLGEWTCDLNIIDEAAFATEPDVAIPIARSMSTALMVLLVGDDLQLVPVVVSTGMQELDKQYGYPLFKRVLQEMPAIPFVMLRENYRMHTDIAEFPACIGYKGLLCNPSSTDAEQSLFNAWAAFCVQLKYDNHRVRDEKIWDQSVGYRRLFFDTDGFSAPRPGGSSLQNFANINYMIEVLDGFGNFLLGNNIPMYDNEFVVQVPYSAQKNELIHQIRLRCDKRIGDWVKVQTIDGTQGGQSVLSWICITPANSHHGSQIGFLDLWNRMNVALTRAKAGVVIWGAFETLCKEFEVFWGRQKYRNWALFLADIMLKGDLVDITKERKANKTHEIFCSRLPARKFEKDLEFWSKVLEPPKEVPLSRESKWIMEGTNKIKHQKALQDAVIELKRLKKIASDAVAELQKNRDQLRPEFLV